VDLASVVLNFEAAVWERGAGYSIRQDAAMLGTVYSQGADFCLERWSRNAGRAAPNLFGRWIEAQVPAILRAIGVDGHARTNNAANR